MKTGNGAGNITLWFIVGFVVLAVVAAIVAGVMSGGSDSSSSNFVATTAPAVSAADWAQGNKDAKVTLIEYGDFECPACAQYYPLVTKLVASYNGKVKFIFRNFPLYSIHPNAGISSQAAEAAGLQGKFFDMYGLLYSKQNEWATTAPNEVVAKHFNGYAASLGLDMKRFAADLNAPAVLDKIKSDVAGANSAQVDHTPTFFVNLKQIPNPSSYEGFKTVLDKALAEADAASAVPAKN